MGVLCRISPTSTRGVCRQWFGDCVHFSQPLRFRVLLLRSPGSLIDAPISNLFCRYRRWVATGLAVSRSKSRFVQALGAYRSSFLGNLVYECPFTPRSGLCCRPFFSSQTVSVFS